MYLCYDIRGVQSFIFQIPRLRHIIGGSALIDRMDRVTVPAMAAKNAWSLISSGGGKGAFECDLGQADAIQTALIAEAHGFGADIRFGRHDDYSEAANCADRLFPYLPGNLDGHPCKESGLYPVSSGDVHEVVKRRNWDGGDILGRWFEARLQKKGITLMPGLPADKLVFMRDVDEDTAGWHALGRRNRWAVICMDGNDMGGQFRAMRVGSAAEKKSMTEWVKAMSHALDTCSERACLAGMQRVAAEWAGSETAGADLQDGLFKDKDGAVVLPLRPLVVGGDDIVVLCHAAYATTFVQEACRVFTDESIKFAQEAKSKGLDLWPATGGHITISAGLLYCGTSLPLATAIPYAESLLALAKKKGRELKGDKPGVPSPACVDFEAVTESMLDHPLTRRERELVFDDGDRADERVELTCRPYSLEAFDALLKDSTALELPGSILHQILPTLQTGYQDRRLFRWRLGKHQENLAVMLAEDDDQPGVFPSGSRWKRLQTGPNRWIRRTDLCDLILLAQESRRMSQETMS